HHCWEAQTLAKRGRDLFEELGFASKTIMSLVLLGRIALALDEIASAEAFAAEISAITEKTTLPLLFFPCYLLSADIAEKKQQWQIAKHFYGLAADDLELHQTRLHHDDLRVTFFKGKYRVYEALVWLALRSANPSEALALGYAASERAKSRSLIDL